MHKHHLKFRQRNKTKYKQPPTVKMTNLLNFNLVNIGLDSRTRYAITETESVTVSVVVASNNNNQCTMNMVNKVKDTHKEVGKVWTKNMHRAEDKEWSKSTQKKGNIRRQLCLIIFS